METRASLIAAALAVGLAAPGAAHAQGHNRPAAPAYSQEDVGAALGLTRSPHGIAWQDGAEQCVASVILRTRKDIKRYADAGDAVATNPAGTVGVKVGAYQGVHKRMCFDRFQAALEKLD